MKQLLFVLLTFFLLPTSGKSNCTIDNNNEINGDTPTAGLKIIGQQFIACETGFVESIELQIDFDITSTTLTTGNLDFYIQAGNGSTITVGTPHQVFNNISDGPITLQLATPFAVTKGQHYAFAVGGSNIQAITFDMNPNNSSADVLFAFEIDNADTFDEQMPSDLYFAVNISVPFIPTLSQWGLLVLGLLVLNLSVHIIQRKGVAM